MGLNASKIKGSNRGENFKEFKPQDPIEAGTYPARVVQVLDLGLQEQRPYQGQEKPPANEIMLTYELLDEFCLDDDGEPMEDKPRWISETMPIRSLQSELAKSTKRYEAIDPSHNYSGDFSQMVGDPCMVTITVSPPSKKTGKVYNNITGVASMRVKQAKSAPELVNPPKTFDLDEPDMEVFESLPEWLQDKIKGNLEFSGSTLESVLKGGKPKKEELPEEPEEESEEDEDDGEW